MGILLTELQAHLALVDGLMEYDDALRLYNVRTGARLKRGHRPKQEDFTNAAIAGAQLRQAARWLKTKVEENFIAYSEYGSCVVEDRVALPVEDWETFLLEAASG